MSNQIGYELQLRFSVADVVQQNMDPNEPTKICQVLRTRDEVKIGVSISTDYDTGSACILALEIWVWHV